MPDRIIRDDLLRSARFCKLPTDTDRMAYIAIRLRSDDFGNLEAGTWNIFRMLSECTTIKTEEITGTVLGHLSDSDLIRFYKDGEHEYIHCPRSRPQNSYLVRKCPPSPWCNPKIKLGKHVRSVRNQGHAKNLPVTLLECNGDVLQGVGVGVGVGVSSTSKTTTKAKPPAQAPFVLPDDMPKMQWDAWIESRTKARKAPTNFAMRLAVSRLIELQEQGHHPARVLAQSAFNGWSGLFPIKEEK